MFSGRQAGSTEGGGGVGKAANDIQTGGSNNKQQHKQTSKSRCCRQHIRQQAASEARHHSSPLLLTLSAPLRPPPLTALLLLRRHCCNLTGSALFNLRATQIVCHFMYALIYGMCVSSPHLIPAVTPRPHLLQCQPQPQPLPLQKPTRQPATVTNPPRPNDDILRGGDGARQLMSCSCQKFCCCLRLRRSLCPVIYTSLFSTNAAHKRHSGTLGAGATAQQPVVH